jgi:hypothetical protein
METPDYAHTPSFGRALDALHGFEAKRGSSANPGRPLENIALAADRVAKAQFLIGEFVDRFHGASPAAPAGSEGVSVTYRDSLTRLFAAIEALETRVMALSDIG